MTIRTVRVEDDGEHHALRVNGERVIRLESFAVCDRVAFYLQNPDEWDTSEACDVGDNIRAACEREEHRKPTDTTGAPDVWHDADGTLRDENALAVRPVDVIQRVRALETALGNVLGELGELREGLGDRAFDDRVTSGIHNWTEAAALIGADAPAPLNLDPCRGCGLPLFDGDASEGGADLQTGRCLSCDTLNACPVCPAESGTLEPLDGSAWLECSDCGGRVSLHDADPRPVTD